MDRRVDRLGPEVDVDRGTGEVKIRRFVAVDDCGNISGGSFMDYLVPTSMETPNWETDKTITPCPHHPLGAKGVGESATVGAPPAIVNAVVDALSHLGVTHMEIPMTPERVWTVLKEKGAAL